jgi:4a-hydroxytetrahydrobiopterin dehydratase
MSTLSQKSCVPCRGGVPPLTPEQRAPLAAEIPAWRVIEGHLIERVFRFEDFRSALNFVNKIGDLSDLQGHHPELQLSWGKVIVQVWTHKIGGLTERDFVLAAKIDDIDRGPLAH